jgi:hypothetical protein
MPWVLVIIFTVAGLFYSTAAFAQTPAAVGWDAKVIAFLTSLVPLMGALQGLGLITKYMPVKALGYINNHIIPLGQTVLIFLGAFGGAKEVVSLLGPDPAYAGFRGIKIGPELGFLAKAGASIILGGISRNVFECYVRPFAEGVLKWQNNEALVGRAEAKI